MEAVLQHLPFAHRRSPELHNCIVRSATDATMGKVSTDDRSTNLLLSSDRSPRSSSWPFFGRSLCSNVSASSPSPLSGSISSPQSSSCSRPNSIRSSDRFSSREHVSLSKSLGQSRDHQHPHRSSSARLTNVKSASVRRGSSSMRSTGHGIAAPGLDFQLRRPRDPDVGKLPGEQFHTSSTKPIRKTENKVANGYAVALADLAKSMGCLEAVNKDIEHLTKLLENEELHEFLTSPDIADTKKKNILRTVAEDVGFHKYSVTFVNALVERKRIALVKDVVREFEKIYNHLTDTQVATVISAAKMDAGELAAVAKKIKSLSGTANVKVKNVVDQSLIAGYIINYDKNGSRFLDMSVRGQLDRLAP